MRTQAPGPAPVLDTIEPRGWSGLPWLRLLVLACAVALLWPLQWGGMLGTVIVTGHSMEPTYHPGDLLVVVRQDAAVGDVVVYVPPVEPRARIVHRIVDGEAETGLTLQGDGNEWRDPFLIQDEAVVGVVRVRIPALGRLAGPLTNPIVLVSLALGGIGLMLWPRREDQTPGGSA